MIFHGNRLLADDSHVIPYLIFVVNRKGVAKFVVCCSRDWRFKDQIYDRIQRNFGFVFANYLGTALVAISGLSLQTI